ncbi:hypothetical protein AAIH02_32915, partial [Pseudomonas aeruginosa]
MKITADQLDRATGCGGATASVWVEHINGAMARFEINTPERVAMFLAQVGHESQSLKRLVENLNYSAEGLLKTWPKLPVQAVEAVVDLVVVERHV